MALIKAVNMFTGVFCQYSWHCCAVKASLTFLEGVPALNTELHSAYPGWLMRTTHVIVCHIMITLHQNEFGDNTKTSGL